MQDPNPLDKGKRLRNMDVPEAAAYAKSQDVRLYTVNVEPKLAEEEFAPYRHVMQRASESTGGKFYMMDNSTSLEEIYKDIDSLEKSAIPSSIQVIDKESRPDLYRSIPFYPWLVAAGLVCLLSSICLETLWLKQIP
jgi:Ca-activated chloride channel family protein